MNKMMGIIMTGGKRKGLGELGSIRSGSAVPVGGKYRAIDFTLSNMVNSGITSVGILTQFSFRSLIDHLGSGKEWDLDRRYNGLFIFPPALMEDNTGWYRGTADAIYQNLSFLRRSNEEFVVITQGDCVYKMNYRNMLDTHLECHADITVAYREMYDYSQEELRLLGILDVQQDGRITDLQEKPRNPYGRNASLGIYLLKRELLINLLEECAAHGNYDFVKDILIKKLNALSIHGYKFDGYWRNLATIGMYFRCNMEMLDPGVRNSLFIQNGKIYTKVKDESPAKYNEEAKVQNSIVGDGCIIEGTVENSILFRGVMVKRGAVVKDSIVMQSSVIGENAALQYVILDKNVVVTGNKSLKGEQTLPVIVGKDHVV